MTDESSPVDFMTPLAASCLAVCPWFFSLYYVNRRVYPLAQREPVITLIGNICFWIAAQVWMLELSHNIPCFVDVFNVQLLVGVTMVCFSMKVWKIFLDAGLTSELESSKFGWFVAHRSWRARKSLHKVAAVMITFHLALFIYVSISVDDQLMGNALACDTTLSSLVFGGLGVVYLILFIIASCLLAKVRDGFFIKSELRMVGIGSGFIAIGWMVRIAADLPCEIYECNTTLLWCCWLALFLTSTIYPLTKAMFERKFIWWWDFCRKREKSEKKKKQRRGSHSETQSSQTHSSGGSYAESEVTATMVRNPMRALATQLTTKDPNLARLKKLPLTRILSNTSGKEAFRRFTVLEFSVENLLFTEAVAKYRLSAPTKEDMKELFDTYVSNTAPSQVNLPNKIVKKMQESLDTAQGIQIRAFFDEAYDHVMKLMQRDSYRRFQDTADFLAIASSMDDAELNEQIPSDTLTTSLGSEGASSTRLTPQTMHTPLALGSRSFDSESSGLSEPIARKHNKNNSDANNNNNNSDDNDMEEKKEEVLAVSSGEELSPRRSTFPNVLTPRKSSAVAESPRKQSASAAESPRKQSTASPAEAPSPRKQSTAAATAASSSAEENEISRRVSAVSRKQSTVVPSMKEEEEEEAEQAVVTVTAITIASTPTAAATSTPTAAPAAASTPNTSASATTATAGPSASPPATPVSRKVSHTARIPEVAIEIADFSSSRDQSSSSRGSLKDSYQLLE